MKLILDVVFSIYLFYVAPGEIFDRTFFLYSSVKLQNVLWLIRLRYPYTVASKPVVYVQIAMTIFELFEHICLFFFPLSLDTFGLNFLILKFSPRRAELIIYFVISNILLLTMLYLFFRVLHFALQIPAPPPQTQTVPMQQAMPSTQQSATKDSSKVNEQTSGISLQPLNPIQYAYPQHDLSSQSSNLQSSVHVSQSSYPQPVQESQSFKVLKYILVYDLCE